jgi:hypothetical protein
MRATAKAKLRTLAITLAALATCSTLYAQCAGPPTAGQTITVQSATIPSDAPSQLALAQSYYQSYASAGIAVAVVQLVDQNGNLIASFTASQLASS